MKRVFFLCMALASSFAGAAVRPNIVVFLSDDHTRRDSSVYGSTDIATPNMQRLAGGGMTFDNAFVVSPSCAPSRAALLTGLLPQHNGAEPNHARPRADIKKLPAYFQELGYEVVAFGKVGHYAQTREYGFDLARHYHYHEDVAIPKALEWLRARQSSKPLCLFVGSNWPHVPWPEDPEGIDPSALRIPPHHVDTAVTRQSRAQYTAAIRIMDRELGQVFDLAREKLGPDTFFLHTSDHGAQWPFSKWTLYDDGLHTPLLVSWPGRIGPGARTPAMVTWVDILPTLIEVAGGTPPDGLDGKSFLPVLLGKTNSHRDRAFATHSGDGDNNVYPSRSLRTLDGWKYIRNLHPEFRFTSHITHELPGAYWTSWLHAAETNSEAAATVRRYQERPAEELYHVTADPYEEQNLAADSAQAARLAEFRKNLDQWLADTRDTRTVFGHPQLITRAASKPNLIMVLIDDMGWSDLSCFGGQAVKTGNIDRLAAEGLRFTQFYVNSPICSPSRVALHTGQYPQRWRITSYLDNRQMNRRRGMAQWLDLKAPSLPHALRRAGYATGHFGKWHMGGQRDVGNAPLVREYGFDQTLCNFEGLGPRVLPLCDAYDGSEPRRHDLGSASLGHGPIRWEDRSRVTAAFVSDAVAFIRRARVTDQPFYINLWPDDVHSPFFPPKAKRNSDQKRDLYHAVLDAMDEQLGLLFDTVRNDPFLRTNTIIVLASDNGPEPGAGISAPLKGNKGFLHEGGIRSPLIVWAPGFMEPAAVGRTNTTAVFCSVDLNASLYALAGVAIPAGQSLDGENVAATLMGRSPTGRHAPICWRRPPDRPGPAGNPAPDLAIRDARWKLLLQYDDSHPRLYDLASDPSETTNLASQHPEVVSRLRKTLLDWNADMPPDAASESSIAVRQPD